MHWWNRRAGRRAIGRALALAALVFTGTACADDESPVGPAPELRTNEQFPCADDCGETGGDDGGGGGGGYNTSYDYGAYAYTYRSTTLTLTDASVNLSQADAFAIDSLAFVASSRDWNDPETVAAWPAAAVVGGVRGAVAVGRLLMQTSAVRQNVLQGARWARDIAVAVGNELQRQAFPVSPTEDINAIPTSDFEFIFDYAKQ